MLRNRKADQFVLGLGHVTDVESVGEERVPPLVIAVIAAQGPGTEESWSVHGLARVPEEANRRSLVSRPTLDAPIADPAEMIDHGSIHRTTASSGYGWRYPEPVGRRCIFGLRPALLLIRRHAVDHSAR